MGSTVFAKLLAGNGSVKTFGPNEVIHLNDIPPYSVYLILQGKVKHTFIDHHGEERTILILKEGEVFGEVTYFQQDTNMVVTYAVQKTVVEEIRAETFSRLLAKHPQLYAELTRLLAYKLRIVMHQLQDMSFQSVQGRVCNLLLRLAKQHGVKTGTKEIDIDLDLTHQEVANMVGAYRSTVTKVLNHLRKEKLIQLRSKKITILDADGLRSWQTE